MCVYYVGVHYVVMYLVIGMTCNVGSCTYVRTAHGDTIQLSPSSSPVQVRSDEDCDGAGTLTCGVCECDPGRYTYLICFVVLWMQFYGEGKLGA